MVGTHQQSFLNGRASLSKSFDLRRSAGSAFGRVSAILCLWPAGLALVAGLMVMACLSLTSGPQGSGQYLVVSAPSHVIQTIFRSGGGIVAQGMVPGLMVAWSDDPGFSALARQNGAWLVLPTSGFAGCGPASGGAAP